MKQKYETIVNILFGIILIPFLTVVTITVIRDVFPARLISDLQALIFSNTYYPALTWAFLSFLVMIPLLGLKLFVVSLLNKFVIKDPKDKIEPFNKWF